MGGGVRHTGCLDVLAASLADRRASIHEAMEQQTTSVAKAGMVVQLHTRAAVFGTCNPGKNQRCVVGRPLPPSPLHLACCVRLAMSCV